MPWKDLLWNGTTDLCIWQWVNTMCIAKSYCILSLYDHCCVSIYVPLLHFNEAVAGIQALINLKMKHYPSCAIDVPYMRWQIQAIPCAPSVIISFSPGRVLSEYPLTTNNVKCWGEGMENKMMPHRLIAHMGVESVFELMTHKHTWLHNSGETDCWNDSTTPGECNFNK